MGVNKAKVNTKQKILVNDLISKPKVNRTSMYTDHAKFGTLKSKKAVFTHKKAQQSHTQADVQVLNEVYITNLKQITV